MDISRGSLRRIAKALKVRVRDLGERGFDNVSEAAKVEAETG